MSEWLIPKCRSLTRAGPRGLKVICGEVDRFAERHPRRKRGAQVTGRRRYVCFPFRPARTRFMIAERSSADNFAHRALGPAPAAAFPPFLPRRRRCSRSELFIFARYPAR